MDPAMNFCSACGAPVTQRIPAGDSLPRHVCDACGTIHYRNPRLVVGALPEWEDRVLLCRRAIEPRHGKWTLPAGFMENGESVADAAMRETLEEACARIELGRHVHPDQRAAHPPGACDLPLAAARPGFRPGVETLELRLFREDEIPWDEIAFRTIAITLRHFFADRRAGNTASTRKT
jgi:8-oxo-dGTP pyrophosphatase MutT (NUDIX family)